MLEASRLVYNQIISVLPLNTPPPATTPSLRVEKEIQCDRLIESDKKNVSTSTCLEDENNLNESRLNLSESNEKYLKPIEIPVNMIDAQINDPRRNNSIPLKKYASFQIIDYNCQDFDEEKQNNLKEDEPTAASNFSNNFLFDLINSIQKKPCVDSTTNIMESLLKDVAKPMVCEATTYEIPIDKLESTHSSAAILNDIREKFKNVEENSSTVSFKMKRNRNLEKILDKRNDYYFDENNKNRFDFDDEERKNNVFSSLKSLMNYDLCKTMYEEKRFKKNLSDVNTLNEKIDLSQSNNLDESIDLYCDLDLMPLETDLDKEEEEEDVKKDEDCELNKILIEDIPTVINSEQNARASLSKLEINKKDSSNATSNYKDRSRRDRHEKKPQLDDRRYSSSRHDKINSSSVNNYERKKYKNDNNNKKYKENDHYDTKRSSSHNHHHHHSTTLNNDYRKRKRSPVENERTRDKHSKY